MNKMPTEAVFFWGNAQKEILAFDGEVKEMFPGSIIKYIIESEDELWDNVSNVAKELAEICAREYPVEVISTEDLSNEIPLNVRNEVSKKYVAGLIEAITKAKEILDFRGAMVLKELVCFCPARSSYTDAEQKLSQVLPSAEREAKNTRNIRNVARLPHETEEDRNELSDMRDDTRKAAIIDARWKRLLCALIEDIFEPAFTNSLNQAQDRKAMLDVIAEYSDNLNRLCIEARKLKRDIPIAIGIRESEVISKEKVKAKLRENTKRANQLWAEEGRKVFGDVVTKGGDYGYSATSLSTLVLLEMELFSKYGFEVKECEYCHSYYATRKSNVKYCPYPNPNHKGESCRKIAPKILYWSRSKMLKEYRKACESYERWIKRTKADDDKAYDYIKLLKADIIAEFEEEEKEKGEVWRKLMDKVKDEITFLFFQWDNNARQSIEDYGAGKISEEDCQTSFVLPSVKERSPMLAYMKKRGYDIDKDFLKELGIIK